MFSRCFKKNLALAAALPVALVATLGSGTANAAQLTCNLSDFSGCQSTLGDKSFSGFSVSAVSGTFTGNSANDLIVIDEISSTQFQIYLTPISATQNFGGTLNYSVAITPAGIAAGNTFGVGQANVNGAGVGSQSTTVASSGLSSSAFSSNGSGSLTSFKSGVTSATFAQTFVTDTKTLNQTGFAFTQSSPTTVPGPLPVLGAGAAFGFSRKLRKRIKQAA
jgi:hypothetical protein